MRKLLLLSFFSLVAVLAIAQNKPTCSFTLTNTIIDSSCAYPECHGIYILTAIGGTPPYDWPTGRSYETKDTVTENCPNTYIITVKDTAGCTATTTVVMPLYKTIHIDSIRIIKQPSCTTCCDGKIQAYPGCGYVPYTFSWSSGQNNGTDTAACAGTTYTFCVTDSHAHTACDSIKVPSGPTVVMPIVPNQVSLLISPNPSNGKFTIEVKGDRENEKVEIYNVLGEKIYSQSSILNSQFTIDLSSKSSGIYFYRITSEKGEFVGNGKLVIQ